MPRMISLSCPNCDAPLQAPEERERIFCQFCGTPVMLHRPAQADSGSNDVRWNGPIQIPEKLQVEDHGDELILSWRWFNWSVLFLAPFCIAWNAFLIGWYGMAGVMGDAMPGPMRFIFLVFPIGHVAVGLGLLYAVLVMLFNRTTVSIRHGLLTVRHGPIWHPGGQSHPVDDVAQLHCRQETSNGKNGSRSITHPLMLQLQSGATRKLISSTDYSLARAVERLVEQRLGLPDVPVDGEHRPLNRD